MTAIIFGANGQDGYYLSNLLSHKGVKVIGVSRNNSNWIKGDVGNFKFVESLIYKHRPEYVFHLAANSTTRHNVVFENHETISTGTLNILESVYQTSPTTKVFISGSGLQFKNSGLPISEFDPFEASSPYCVSRIQSVYAARYYRSLGIKTYVGYFFHHDSPMRSERHLNMKIAKAALKIKEGSSGILEIGDIDVVKEYNDAEDFMRAIWMLVNQDNVFETVIGSGRGYSIRDWLDICFQKVDMNWQDFVKTNSEYSPEFKSLVSNPTTLFSLGWKPLITIHELAENMMMLKL
jgi:GDPmannose 4,6-dehydratase